jgi:hypothetical protein
MKIISGMFLALGFRKARGIAHDMESKMKKCLKTVLVAHLLCAWSGLWAAPSVTNSNIEKVAKEFQIPSVLLKAVAWQESSWTQMVNGQVYVSPDGGVGIMQIQGGDRNLSEVENIRNGARALIGKWQLNVSTQAQQAVRSIGGIDEDFDINILENWWVPLAAYNGYSGSDQDGHGGGKGYARAIFSLISNPSSYINYRPDSGPRQTSVAADYRGYFGATAPLSDPFKIIPKYTGGTKSKIQAYTLCDLLKNKGKIHRWDEATQRILEITSLVGSRCNSSLSAPTPSPAAATIQNIQAQGVARINTPAIILLNGVNLTAQVLVTVSNCDQPKTELLSTNQIKHQCVPRLPGEQKVGWKTNSTIANVTVAGSIYVQGEPVASPTMLTSSQLGQMVLGTNYSKVTQEYLAKYDQAPVEPNGETGTGYHPGIDYRAAEGTDVRSPVSGLVTGGWEGNYGTISIKVDGSETRVLLMHTSISFVKTGDRVTTGCLIGRSGKTGTKDPHLHVETRQGRNNGAYYFKSPAHVGYNIDPLTVVGRYIPPNESPARCADVSNSNNMGFVGESLPDGSSVNAGRIFSKTWMLKNTGTTTWDSSYCLHPISGDSLAAANVAVCVVGTVIPSATYSFNASLLAPSAKAVDSSYKQVWALRKAGGAAIGSPVSVQVVVKATEGPPLNLVHFDVLPHEITAGDKVIISAKLNFPASGVRAVLDNVQAGPNISLDKADTQGLTWSKSVPINLAGPAALNYGRPIWVIAKDLSGKEREPIGPFQLYVRPSVADASQFIRETLPDNSIVSGAATIGKSWTLRNTGTSIWTSAFCLKSIAPAPLGASAACVNGKVAPGEEYVFAVNLVTPVGGSSEQTLRQEWQLFNAANLPVGAKLSSQLKVKAASAAFRSVSATPSTVMVGQSMTFQALLSAEQGVARVELVFPDTNITQAMSKSGTNLWAATRTMSQAGGGRFHVRLTTESGAQLLSSSTYNVTSVDKPLLAITNFEVSPKDISVGNTVSFSATTNSPASAVRVIVDALQGGTSIALSKADAQGLAWSLSKLPVNVAGNPAQNYLRPLWVLAKDANGKEMAPMGPYQFYARPAAVSTDSFQVVRETLPNNSFVPAATAASKSWTLRNTGTSTWNSRYCLTSSAPTPFGASTNCVNGQVAPGADYTFTVNLTAPAATLAEQTLGQDWQLLNQTKPIGGKLSALLKIKGQAVGNDVRVGAVSPLTWPLGKAVSIVVDGSNLAPTIRVQLVGEQCTQPVGSLTQRIFQCSNNTAVAAKKLKVLSLQGASLAEFDFVTQLPATGGVVQPPPAPLSTTLTKSDSVISGNVWRVQLQTSSPIAAAELVFESGRRIPFIGGATQWDTDPRQSVFGDPSLLNYSLRVQRAVNDAWVTYPGGKLEVRTTPPTSIQLSVTSPSTVTQGQPYVFQLKSSLPAARVTVTWPDISEGGMSSDAAHVNWQMPRTMFGDQPLNYSVKAFNENNQLIGEIKGVVSIMKAPASLRVLDITKSIVINEQPNFAVESSLSIEKVTVQLADATPVALASTGSNQLRTFSGRVLASVSGASVPYKVTGYGAQGQALTAVTGTVAVAAAGDALKGSNPVPPSVEQGTYANWQFPTNKSPEVMWMEFDAPIGRVALEGAYLKYTFNVAPGAYNYKLMRKDNLGNVFPIQGASGRLTVLPHTVLPSVGNIIVNGAPVRPEGTIEVKLSGGLLVLANAAGAKGLVLKLQTQAFGSVYMPLIESGPNVWQTKPLPAPTIGQHFQGLVAPGTTVPAQIYWGTGGTNRDVNLGGTVNFTIRFVP